MRAPDNTTTIIIISNHFTIIHIHIRYVSIACEGEVLQTCGDILSVDAKEGMCSAEIVSSVAKPRDATTP